jgi:hypothetical protein
MEAQESRETTWECGTETEMFKCWAKFCCWCISSSCNCWSTWFTITSKATLNWHFGILHWSWKEFWLSLPTANVLTPFREEERTRYSPKEDCLALGGASFSKYWSMKSTRGIHQELLIAACKFEWKILEAYSGGLLLVFVQGGMHAKTLFEDIILSCTQQYRTSWPHTCVRGAIVTRDKVGTARFRIR